jgi:hypothetical protein
MSCYFLSFEYKLCLCYAKRVCKLDFDADNDGEFIFSKDDNKLIEQYKDDCLLYEGRVYKTFPVNNHYILRDILGVSRIINSHIVVVNDILHIDSQVGWIPIYELGTNIKAKIICGSPCIFILDKDTDKLYIIKICMYMLTYMDNFLHNYTENIESNKLILIQENVKSFCIHTRGTFLTVLLNGDSYISRDSGPLVKDIENIERIFNGGGDDYLYYTKGNLLISPNPMSNRYVEGLKDYAIQGCNIFALLKSGKVLRNWVEIPGLQNIKKIYHIAIHADVVFVDAQGQILIYTSSNSKVHQIQGTTMLMPTREVLAKSARKLC